MQPEIRNGEVYLKEPPPGPGISNPQFVVELSGRLVSIIGDDKVAVPLIVNSDILAKEQMEAVMIMVAMALIAMDTIKPGDEL